MCRFIAYIGKPIVMSTLVIEPSNSLVNQSTSAHETEEPLNGDGFGLGWYNNRLAETPALYTSVRPAWNDRNLIYLADKIRSNCIFAHVRAATEGVVNELNCHPFHYKKFLFMHNGSIGGFNSIKRYLRRDLSDEIYEWVKGQTDSEHFFAIFLNKLNTQNPEPIADNYAKLLQETVVHIEKIKKEHNITETSYINVALTDGEKLVALRYVSSSEEEPSTLYYSEGTKYVCVDGVCKMVVENPEEHSVLVVSEKLTDSRSDWKPIPRNFILLVKKDLSCHLRPMEV